MNQLTIRGFDDELADRIRALARREGISLNRAVLRLLRRGAGLGDGNRGPDTVGDSLDHLIGTWTAAEAAEMGRAPGRSFAGGRGDVEVRILLDSNAYPHLKRGHRPVAELVRGSAEILVPYVVIGELLYGFRSGSRFERNVRELNAFLDSPHVAIPPVTLTTADRYSRVAAALRAKGRPIPSNDIWIAAHTLETGADLVSGDRHFGEIDGLAWIPVAAED